MFDHIGVVVSDRDCGWQFYERVLEPLGIRGFEKHPRPNGEGWMVMSSGAPRSPFFVVAAGRPSFWSEANKAAQSPVHLCFSAPSKEAVDRFHAIGLQSGAKDNGAPGVRREPFYCAFLIDPDGNNIEAGVYLQR
ncbi:MAG TPA: VOC family protein [Hyphomonadaceae bacterium]|nr:VOC family protein [Hyphomonadaceae bacterium]